jgi:hypothetical protein
MDRSTFRGNSRLAPLKGAAAILCALSLLTWPAFGVTHFSAPNYNLTMSSHIVASGQTCSGSTVLTLTHDSPCTLAISVARLGDEILSNGTETLTTSYKITGGTLLNPDPDWVDSNSFLSHIYTFPGTGIDDITIWAQGTAPPHTAADAGDYTGALILTVSW